MTYRTRKSSFKPSSSPKSSATISYASRRRRTPKDHDFTSVSPPNRSPNDSEFDDQEPENDEDDGYASSDYAASDSLFDHPLTDQFSSRANSRSVSQGTNDIRNESSASLASNTPNFAQPSTQITSSFMNIAPFPIFHGAPNECPVAHLSRFNKVCRANNVSSIDMMTKIFPVTLEDESALWYDLNIEPYTSSLTWEEIKSSFSQAYGKIELKDELRSQLMGIKQGNEESVRSYFLRLQWILMKWPEHGLSENMLKGVFIDGLREDFRDGVIPQKPSSLNEALRVAFGFEQLKCVRGVRRNVPLKCGFCGGLHEEKGCEVRERMRKLWLQSKEEGLRVGLEKKISGNGGVVKEFGRSVSMVTSRSTSGTVMGNNEVELEKEEGEVLGLKKKSQCQCWKHQCWKKKLERNFSNVSGNFKGE